MLTNTTGMSLSVAVWLAQDKYDHSQDPNEISVTGLLNSTRKIILSSRADTEALPEDVSNKIASGFGNAVHNAIEDAWLNDYESSLLRLGYPEKVVKNVRVNPEPNEMFPGIIPIYLEQRQKKKVGKWLLSGKFDIVADGGLEDFKTTGVYSYINKSNEDKFRLQGSMYRWLNPDIITKDHMTIQYIFTDWSKLRAMTEAKKGYPAQRITPQTIELLPIQATEQYITSKLNQLENHADTPECELPLCNAEDLWQADPVFKYYKNPVNPEQQSRSTANFPTFYEAQTRLLKDGSKGVVLEIKGKVKACAYCNGFALCTQKDQYLLDGSLVIS